MAKKASVPDEAATTQINIADFRRTRDSVIVALATLQSSVQDLSRAYINHANTVLSPDRGGELNANLTNILSESGLLTGAAPAALAVVEEIGPDGKKKRKRQPHDPNAPKRALTPYFLYMQSARTQIAKELGDHAKPKEVADEGTRRWSEMGAAEKSVWIQLYQKNYAAYRVKMTAYKAGNPVPTDEEAAAIVAAGKAPAIVPGEAADVDVESSPEPPMEPEPPKKRRKSEKTAETPAKEKETPKAAKSADKKSKKSKKEEEVAPEPASTSKAADKKKRSKKA